METKIDHSYRYRLRSAQRTPRSRQITAALATSSGHQAIEEGCSSSLRLLMIWRRQILNKLNVAFTFRSEKFCPVFAIGVLSGNIMVDDCHSGR